MFSVSERGFEVKHDIDEEKEKVKSIV